MAGWSKSDAVSAFESFIRSGDPSFQQKLLDPQQRAGIRKASMREAKNLCVAQAQPAD